MLNVGQRDCRYAFIYNNLRPDNDQDIPYAKAFLTNMRCQKAVLRGAKLYDTAFATVKLSDWQVDEECKKPDNLEEEPVVHGWVVTCKTTRWANKLMQWYLVEGFNMFDPTSSPNQKKIVDVELCDEHIGDKIGEAGSSIKSCAFHN